MYISVIIFTPSAYHNYKLYKDLARLLQLANNIQYYNDSGYSSNLLHAILEDSLPSSRISDSIYYAHVI